MSNILRTKMGFDIKNQNKYNREEVIDSIIMNISH
jgi:hypothetical protein